MKQQVGRGELGWLLVLLLHPLILHHPEEDRTVIPSAVAGVAVEGWEPEVPLKLLFIGPRIQCSSLHLSFFSLTASSVEVGGCSSR